MTYVVNPADPTSPLDIQGAGQGAEEFRALKAYIAGLAGLPAGSGVLSGLRNRIINGDFEVDQRLAGSAQGVNNAATFRLMDMWNAFGTLATGVFVVQQLAATPPSFFKNYAHISVTTAEAAPAVGSTYGIMHYIEGNNLIDAAFGTVNAKSIALSFWVRANAVGNYSGSVQNGAQNRAYPFQFTINLAATWEQKTIIIPGDTAGVWAIDNSIGLILWLDIGNGATRRGPANVWAASDYRGVTGSVQPITNLANTLDITGVQLEISTAVTPFERLAFADKLTRCQRYYQKSFLLATVPVQNAGYQSGETNSFAGKAGVNDEWVVIQFKTRMRTIPTLIPFNPNAANAQIFNASAGADCSAVNVTNVKENGGVITAKGSAGTAVGDLLAIHWTAEASM